MSESAFFQDLAILTTIVGIVAIIFAKLRWPKVLGYIAAGVLMSEYTWGGGFLVEEGTFRVIGQLGVIYLMFTMGLDFSMAQIKRIRSVVLPVALIDTLVMTWVGYTIGTYLLGWGMLPSLFFGVAICDSATTMLAKVIDEMKWSGKSFVRYTLGTSVCEDVICVGLIAIVTGVAQGRGISLAAAGQSLGGLFVFFLAIIVFGMVLVPRLLVSVAKTHDNEALLLLILGICFFVSWLAFKLDFSLALGAFLVGIVGASSDVRKRLAEMVAPLKSLYAAIFFVTIGLLLDPHECMQHGPIILLVSALIVIVKFVNCTVGALLMGQSVKTSIQMGMSLAQIGEFAFMVALLYQSVTQDFDCPMFNIVVSASVLTTLLNPWMIRYSSTVGEWVERHLPSTTRRGFETYRGFVAKFQSEGTEVVIHRIVRSCLMNLGLVGILDAAVVLTCIILGNLDYSKFSVFVHDHRRFIFCLVANLFMAAMVVPSYRTARALGRAIAIAIIGRGVVRWRHAFRQIVMLVVVIGVAVLYYMGLSMANVHLKPEELWARWAIRCTGLLVLIFGWHHMRKALRRAGTRFNEALGAEERLAKIESVMTFTIPEDHVSHLTLDASSPAVGETIGSLNVRAKTGAVIASIEREGFVMRTVGPQVELHVGDTLVAVGEGHQIAALKDLLGIVS